MEVDSSGNVRMGMVEDAMEIEENKSCGAADVAEKDEEDGDTTADAPIPPVSAMAAMFSDIRRYSLTVIFPAQPCVFDVKRGR